MSIKNLEALGRTRNLPGRVLAKAGRWVVIHLAVWVSLALGNAIGARDVEQVIERSFFQGVACLACWWFTRT